MSIRGHYAVFISHHIPVHPCDTKKKGGCGQICKKKGDDAVCECKVGFTLAADNKACDKGNNVLLMFVWYVYTYK